MDRLNSLPDTINKNQLLFGINQGGTYEDLRIENMKEKKIIAAYVMLLAVPLRYKLQSVQALIYTGFAYMVLLRFRLE